MVAWGPLSFYAQTPNSFLLGLPLGSSVQRTVLLSLWESFTGFSPKAHESIQYCLLSPRSKWCFFVVYFWGSATCFSRFIALCSVCFTLFSGHMHMDENCCFKAVQVNTDWDSKAERKPHSVWMNAGGQGKRCLNCLSPWRVAISDLQRFSLSDGVPHTFLRF